MYLNKFHFPNLKKYSVEELNKNINKMIELNMQLQNTNTPTAKTVTKTNRTHRPENK